MKGIQQEISILASSLLIYLHTAIEVYSLFSKRYLLGTYYLTMMGKLTARAVTRFVFDTSKISLANHL